MSQEIRTAVHFFLTDKAKRCLDGLASQYRVKNKTEAINKLLEDKADEDAKQEKVEEG